MNAINVIPSSSGNGFTMNLRNGSINVDDKTGMYVISTGCGAGKSTSIKELIKLKADKGIMYCVDTIAEADKMNHWITIFCQIRMCFLFMVRLKPEKT